jgi:hypothetical protein
MSNTRHTPGPWEVYTWADKTEVGVSPCDMSRSDIADCNTDCTDISYEEKLANARLIAAAPELLEALRELVDVQGCDCSYLGNECENCKAARRKCTAALSKVEG